MSNSFPGGRIDSRPSKVECPLCKNTRKLEDFEKCEVCEEYVCLYCVEYVNRKGFVCVKCKEET